MSRLLIGLLFGLGLFCIWWSFWPREPKPPASATRRGRLDRLGDELVQAGYAAVGPRALLAMCALMFLLVFVVFFSFTAVPSIALCFAVMAAYAPLALVRSRARRRREGQAHDALAARGVGRQKAAHHHVDQHRHRAHHPPRRLPRNQSPSPCAS